MDLIEVLWKQDVDLGFSVDYYSEQASGSDKEDVLNTPEELEKLKVLKDLNDTKPKVRSPQPSTRNLKVCYPLCFADREISLDLRKIWLKFSRKL